jgi:hypothetical protein
MRARLAWIAGAAGVAGALVARSFRRRSTEAPPRDPADELRRKLDESRALSDEREEFEAGETTVDQAEPAGETVEERRRHVHEDAQAAVDEMQNSGGKAGLPPEPPS